MDSEQIKKDLRHETFFNFNGPFHPEGEASSERVQDHRKLKGQVVAEPEKGGLNPSESPADPWDHDSASKEHRLFSDIMALSSVSISDRVELKKNLSSVYKQAHEMMTRYNQRIQSLLMDDRFLYRHASEISALMIRGLMPPLENIKTLEKSLTSTRKKTEEETIDAVQKSATAELQKVETVLKDAKSRITRYTKPLNPAKLMQKRLEQQLERTASELQQAQKTGTSISLNNRVKTSDGPLPRFKSEPASTLPSTHCIRQEQDKRLEQEISAEDLTSKQLSELAIKLNTANQEARRRITQSIFNYVALEYQHYAPLNPFLSVAEQKCELLSMNPDKVCKACQQAIEVLENASSYREMKLSLETLIQIDKAIIRLASFDKKLPGEVWQLLTELRPDQADGRYHLLNLLCRKLLLDGPTLLTQKTVLKKFQDVSQLLSGVKENAGHEVFDQQYIAAYGGIFTTPAHLKKSINTVNKPHEIHALLQLFSRQKNSEQRLLSGAIEKVRAMGDEQQLKFLITGATAFDFLVTALPEKLSAEIVHYRPSEPNQTHKQLTLSVLTKYTDYYKAIELTRKQGQEVNKQYQHGQFDYSFEDSFDHSFDISNQLCKCTRQLAEILVDSDNRQKTLLNDIGNELQNIINQPQINNQAKQSLAICRITIINALSKEFLTNYQGTMLIKWFLETQTRIEEPGITPPEQNAFQAPQELVQAMASLEIGTSTKWYNQLFTGDLQEKRVRTLGIVSTIIDACQQTVAATLQVGSFIEVAALEITKDNEDPLIKQLGSEMQAYASRLQDI